MDSHTVQLNLPNSDITIVPGMTDYPALIVHRNFEAEGGNLMENPVGTAPWKLISHEVETSAVFEKRGMLIAVALLLSIGVMNHILIV